jgi:hypothetical protein
MGKATELGELIKTTRPFLASISKAKAAKLVRVLVEMFLDMEAGTGFEVELCQVINWSQMTHDREQSHQTGIERSSLTLKVSKLNFFGF